MSARIPFALPDISDEELDEVTAALRSGWVTTGPRVHRFEREFADAVGARHAIAVNSATSGLHLALEAAGVGAGDAVIVPSVTFAACGEVARYLGAHPALADIDAATGLATAATFAAAARQAEQEGWQPRALMPVHFGGQACDLDEFAALAGDIGAVVVEDAAHAFPTTYRGRSIGSIGDFTVFSFYATKTLTTGEGGMVTTDDEAAAARMKVMRLHGISTDAWDRYNTDRPAWQYDIVAPGFKYNLTDVAAAMGLRQLARADSMWARRNEIARRYADAFAGSPLRPLDVVRPSDRHAWHLFVVRLGEEAGVDRDTFIEKMLAAGVGASVHFIPLHRMQYYRDLYGLQIEDFPGSEEYFASCVSLPIYSALTDDQVDRVIDVSLDTVGR